MMMFSTFRPELRTGMPISRDLHIPGTAGPAYYAGPANFKPPFQPDASLLDWLQRQPPDDLARWVDILRRYPQNENAFLEELAIRDAGSLVSLFYSKRPHLFRQTRSYSLAGLLRLRRRKEGTYNDGTAEAALQSEIGQICISALSLFILLGADACTAALLSCGADPNGMESGWEYIAAERAANAIHDRPVSPLDCAVMTDRTDCIALLEKAGGQPFCDRHSLTENPMARDIRSRLGRSVPSKHF